MKTKKKPIVVNIYGGPGAGKSIVSARLYSEMGISSRYGVVEQITEYAKELSWRIRSGDKEALKKIQDQNNVFNSQVERQMPVCQHADFVITDSPIRLSLVYLLEKDTEENKEKQTIEDLNNRADPIAMQYRYLLDRIEKYEKEYDEVNILLKRDPSLSFQKEGRIHGEKESQELDRKIEDMLNKHDVPYFVLQNRADIASLIGAIEEKIILNSMLEDINVKKDIDSVLTDEHKQELDAMVEEAIKQKAL